MITYKRLSDIVLTAPPYRGTDNRFPMFSRRENRKTFLVREESGEKVFDLVYGESWLTHDITKEEYELLDGKNCYAQPYYDKNGNATGHNVYKKYETRHNVIGTVRPDNTFEFTKESYGQGERYYLSNFTRGFFSTDSRRGGMIHRERQRMLPIWHGMRVRSDDGLLMPTEQCEVQITHVNRKKARDLIGGYEQFFKVSEVMLKNVNDEQFLDLVTEVVDQHTSFKQLQAEAMKCMNDAPLDAFAMFAWGYDIDRLRFRTKYKNTIQCSPYEDFYMKTKRKIVKQIYLDNPDVFIPKTYATGEVYPACDWGTTVLVNGKVMEQYA